MTHQGFHHARTTTGDQVGCGARGLLAPFAPDTFRRHVRDCRLRRGSLRVVKEGGSENGGSTSVISVRVLQSGNSLAFALQAPETQLATLCMRNDRGIEHSKSNAEKTVVLIQSNSSARLAGEERDGKSKRSRRKKPAGKVRVKLRKTELF